jgi:peptidoglycan hydrolase CwlO-like protein
MKKMISVIVLSLLVSAFAATTVFAATATKANCRDKPVTKTELKSSNENCAGSQQASGFSDGYHGVGLRSLKD